MRLVSHRVIWMRDERICWSQDWSRDFLHGLQPVRDKDPHQHLIGNAVFLGDHFQSADRALLQGDTGQLPFGMFVALHGAQDLSASSS